MAVGRARLRRVALAALLGLPALAQGQVTPADTVRRSIPLDTARDSAILTPVVVTGPRVLAVAGGAAAVAVRPDSMDALPAAPSLADILRHTPFVLVRQNSRGEAELSVRGSDSRQAAVLLDGLPLTIGWDHRTDPSLLPSSGVEEVRVVRGLASLLDGPNALGGVIALQTARGDRTGAGPGAARTHGSLAASTEHVGGRATAASITHRTPLGPRTLVVQGGMGYRQRRGLSLGDGGTVPAAGGGGVDPGDARDGGVRTNSDHRQLDGFAAARLALATGAHLGVFASGYDAERGTPPELHVSSPRLWRYPSVRRAAVVVSGGSGLRNTPAGTGDVSISVGANAGDLTIESFTDRTYTTRDGSESGRERAWAARVAATHSLGARGQARAGGTMANVRYHERLDGGPVSSYQQRLASAGAEAEYLVGSRMHVTGGVVGDVSSTPESGARPPLGRQSSLGWRVGGSFEASAALRLHASASQRARFPSLRELYSGALARFDPNPALRPERLRVAEVGASLTRVAPGSSLMVQGTLFHHRLHDVIQRIVTAEGLFRRENRDELRSSGLELLADWRGTHGSRPTVSADLVVQHVRLHDAASSAPTRRAEHQPELRGSLTSALTLPGDVRASVASRVEGRQFCEHPDLGQQVALGAQHAFDAAVTRGWSIARLAGAFFQALEVSLAADNVTGRTAYEQCGLPRPGRTIRLGVQLR